MAALTEYSRATSFADAQAAAPSVPLSGTGVDSEFDRVKLALDSTQQSLRLVQRADGALANGSVGIDQIDPAIYTGLRPATAWAGATDYVATDTVFYDDGANIGLYRCLVSHTSGVFLTDLADGSWLLLFEYTPPTAVGVAAIENGGTGATTAAEARDNLGLGGLAVLDTVPLDLGGTGATDLAGAQANLGLEIGVDVQAYDDKLAAEAALSPIADRLSFYTGPTTKNTTPFASSARSLLSLTPAADRMPYYSGSSTASLAVLTSLARTLLANSTAAAMRGTLGVDEPEYVLHVQDQKSNGTDGGTFTSGAWRTRTLTTAVTNTISGASIGSNQVTLPAGTYDVYITCPGHTVDLHQARLYNISDSALAILGTSMFAHASNGVTNVSVVHGRITIAGTKVFKIQHRCQTTKATTGFGDAANFGDGEIYTDAVFRKVA